MTDVSAELWDQLSTTGNGLTAVPPSKPSGFAPRLNDVLAIAELNFGDFALEGTECAARLQAFLDYAGLYALALKGTAFDDQNVRSYVRAVIPRGNWYIKYQIVVPEWVDLHMIGTLIRSIGDPGNPGPLAINRYRPMIVYSANSSASRVNLYCQYGSSAASQGSGAVLSQSWSPSGFTLTAAGSGYSAGDVIFLTQPSKAPYRPSQIKVESVVAGTGAVSGWSVPTDPLRPGVYSRRPRQSSGSRPWAPRAEIEALGVTPLEQPLVFDQVSATRANRTTPSPGTGARFTPSWPSEFQANDRGITSYRTGEAVLTDMLIGQVRIMNAGSDFSPTYGGMFGVYLNLFNADIDRINVLGGYFGIIAQCTDTRANYLNPVSSMVGMVVQGNLFTCPNVVFDTCFLTYLEILPGSTGVTLSGRTLWPYFNDDQQNRIGPVNSGFAFIVGQNWYNEVNDCYGITLNFAMTNSGSAPRETTDEEFPAGGTAALFVANVKNAHINIETSNNFTSTDDDKVFTQFAVHGPRVDAESVLISGMIDGTAGRAVLPGYTVLPTGSPLVVSGGTGYKLYDLVRLDVTPGNAIDAVFQVVGVSAGAVTAVRIVGPGLYSSINTGSPVPTLAVKRYTEETGDTYGSGLTLALSQYGSVSVPGCGVAIRDGEMPGWSRDYGLCDIFKSGVPVDSTGAGTGTGVNKAQKGSRYTDLATGEVYLNTGTINAPVWKKFTHA